MSTAALAGAPPKTKRCTPTSTSLRRRMYETMVYWETAHTVSGQTPVRARRCDAVAGGGEDRLLEDPRRAGSDRSAVCCPRWIEVKARGTSRVRRGLAINQLHSSGFRVQISPARRSDARPQRSMMCWIGCGRVVFGFVLASSGRREESFWRVDSLQG
jgi:hypothetical protein